MKIELYSYMWDALSYGFDIKDALDNWVHYVDSITIAVNTSTDGTYEFIEQYAKEKGYPVKLVSTSFDPVSDPFFYGKVVNAALQACTGDFLIAQDADERLCGDPTVLRALGERLIAGPFKAYFMPTIDLYGSVDKAIKVSKKWYLHSKGLYRGPVHWGIKENGLPDYNKTSCDELVSKEGNLVSTISLGEDLTVDNIKEYADKGLPYSMHLGYLNLKDRVERAIWWKQFWEKATGGDPNGHVTDINVLLARESKAHRLPLWKVR